MANHVPFNLRHPGQQHNRYPATHSTDTHGTNEVDFAILGVFGYQFAPRYRDIRDKMATLSDCEYPSKYDAQFLLKPGSKANTKLILAEEDNSKHIFASLAPPSPPGAP